MARKSLTLVSVGPVTMIAQGLEEAVPSLSVKARGSMPRAIARQGIRRHDGASRLVGAIDPIRVLGKRPDAWLALQRDRQGEQDR